MKKAASIMILIYIGIMILSYFPSTASACSCAQPPSVEEEFERSKAVFSGKVLSIEEKRNLKGYTTKSVLFEVTNTWKGVQQSQIIITTGQGGGDCGFDFIEGQEYLVYANESSMYGSQSFVSIICDRTNKLSSLQDDLSILGEGKLPIEEVDLSDKQEGNHLYIWISVFIVVGIAVAFFIKGSVIIHC